MFHTKRPEHNGEACIESLDPKDRGTERQFWFTRALLCTLLGVKSENTITNHVDKLLKRGVVTETRFLVSVMLPDSLGRECIKMTLYDLKVFNYSHASGYRPSMGEKSDPDVDEDEELPADSVINDYFITAADGGISQDHKRLNDESRITKKRDSSFVSRVFSFRSCSNLNKTRFL